MIKNNSFNLLAARLGRISQVEQDGNVFQNDAGLVQQQRMIRDKRRTLERAMKYSYQGAFIKKDPGSDNTIMRALINPDKTKQDYDDKILSTGYENNLKTGDVFEWCNTKTNWLIYLQDLTELAYFRASIRRCSYEILWDNGNKRTWAAIRGPVETKIDFIQKHGISIDEPNFSLNILMPYNEDNLEQFNRYKKFYLQRDTHKVCWRVEAIDWISMPGIIEVNATEYFANKDEDDIENGIAGALILEPQNPNSEEVDDYIQGETFIKPKQTVTYVCTDASNEDEWFIDKKQYPVSYNIDGNSITVKWEGNYSGQFILQKGEIEKTIIVQSLF